MLANYKKKAQNPQSSFFKGPSELGKGGKWKKRSNKVKHTLTQEDIEFLKTNTRYDEQEIKEWYRCAEYLDY